MPKLDKRGVSTREVLAPISNPQAQEVNAKPVDTSEGIPLGGELEGLVKGLKDISPKLNQLYLFQGRKKARKDLAAGKASASRGEDINEDAGEFFRQGYQGQRGLVEGEKYGAELYEKYLTEFDKDTGSIEEFIKESTQSEVDGIDDESFLGGFNTNQSKFLDKIRTEQLQYQQETVTNTVESDAMFRLGRAYEGRKALNQVLDPTDIEALRKELAGTFGVKNSRFNQLLYNVIDEKGKQGDFDAYSVLKLDRPDGTKGMYHIPAWKAKIDAAQIASQRTYLAAKDAQDRRDDKADLEKQEKTMFSILMVAEDNPEEGLAAFQDATKLGLFETASAYLKFKKDLEAVTDDDESEDGFQIAEETRLTKKILTNPNSVSFIEIAQGNLTSKQRRTLSGLVRSQRGETRSASNNAESTANNTYKSYEFKQAEDNIKNTLKPLLGPLEKVGGKDAALTRITNAKVNEFFHRMKGKKPEEADRIANEIIESGKRLMEDQEVLQTNSDISLILYSTPEELDVAIQAGRVKSMNVIQAHIVFFNKRDVTNREAHHKQLKKERESKFKD